DLPWEIEVDQEKLVVANAVQNGGMTGGLDVTGTPFEKWGDKEWIELGVESQNWTLSQFMHGEQGALLCTAKIVESVPWIDAKYYAATQVMDEARHVEVFSKYLDDKLSGHYPINAHLRMLLDDIISDSRWDMTYLGMQIMVEGLALAAFGYMHQMTTEPLLKQLLRYVMSDEARHVAFGVLSLQEYYTQLSASEIRERQEFAFEAAVRMRDRFLQQEVWTKLGVDPKAVAPLIIDLDDQKLFQIMLFSKIVPNCKKLGLLDAADGWLRERFTEIGVIAFEDWADTGEEYEELQATPGEQAQAS
ncbi:MAG: ferritin-like domain-containing protein, partial [Acidimicrobiales bacterium]